MTVYEDETVPAESSEQGKPVADPGPASVATAVEMLKKRNREVEGEDTNDDKNEGDDDEASDANAVHDDFVCRPSPAHLDPSTHSRLIGLFISYLIFLAPTPAQLD